MMVSGTFLKRQRLDLCSNMFCRLVTFLLFSMCGAICSAHTTSSASCQDNVVNYVNAQYLKLYIHAKGIESSGLVYLSNLKLSECVSVDTLEKIINEIPIGDGTENKREKVKDFYQSLINRTITNYEDADALLVIPEMYEKYLFRCQCQAHDSSNTCNKYSRKKQRETIKKNIIEYLGKEKQNSENKVVSTESKAEKIVQLTSEANADEDEETTSATWIIGLLCTLLFAYLLILLFVKQQKVSGLLHNFRSAGKKNCKNTLKLKEEESKKRVEERQKREVTTDELIALLKKNPKSVDLAIQVVMDDSKYLQMCLDRLLANETIRDRLVERLQIKMTKDNSTDTIIDDTERVEKVEEKKVTREQSVLYADSIYNDSLYNVTTDPTDETTYLLELLAPTHAMFTIFRESIPSIIRNPDFVDGCVISKMSQEPRDVEIEKGETILDGDKWKIIQKAKIKFI